MPKKLANFIDRLTPA